MTHEEADRRFYRKPIDPCSMPLPFLGTGFGAWGYVNTAGIDLEYRRELAMKMLEDES